MTAKKLAWVIAIPVSIVLLVAITWYVWCPGVLVVVTNDTGGMIRNVVIVYTGGAAYLAELHPPGVSYEKHVNPSGESGLISEWTDSSGERRSQYVDIYLESGYTGSIEIKIKPDNTISWTESE